MHNLELDTNIRGDYASVDLFLVPQATQYADLVEQVLERFDEQTVDLILDEQRMPLPYYEALEISVDAFLERYDLETPEAIDVEDAVEICHDLLDLGLFDIGFEGEHVTVFISHDGHVNVTPTDEMTNEFKETIESLEI
ncbi:MAG: hypothetical protein MUP66_00175 [Candidatus Nanohaloarchaeota archaeon QJJ-5]|nr:hypothetical protein [Candidatus Nanohaloarchaeota archaeon QJJ-5]